MASRGKRPAIRADRQAWARLGEMLMRRRAQLGFTTRTAFAEARGVSIRRIGEIENASREDPSSWQVVTLQEIAQFYEVTHDSMLAVLRGEADELVPASPPPAPAASSGLPPAPASGLLHEDAVRPWATPIWDRLLDLAGRGILDPDGAQLGLPPDDAKVWDGSAGAMSLADRAWLVGDIRRRREAFSTGRQRGASSA